MSHFYVEMQRKFLSIIENLPESLRNQLRNDTIMRDSISSIDVARSTKSSRNSVARGFSGASLEADAPSHAHPRARTSSSLVESSLSQKSLKSRTRMTEARYDDSSSSQIDQLIASILEGDVQGIRAVVRSRGDSLTADFWSGVAESVLPLHRAIAGLHFHGSDQLLISTLETLLQLGAPINSQDHAGNTVLHKSLLVCTSSSVGAVVECLLKRRASPSLTNTSGETPLHVECRKLRTASVDVISALLAANADVNMHVLSDGGASISALYIVLQKGSMYSSKLRKSHEERAESMSQSDVSILSKKHSTAPFGQDKAENSGSRVWVKAACLLVKGGNGPDCSG